MTAEIRGEYEYLSGSFAEACRLADLEFRAKQPSRTNCEVERRLPKSTLDALSWSLKYGTDEGLRKFLEGRPADELALIQKFVAWKNPNDQSPY